MEEVIDLSGLDESALEELQQYQNRMIDLIMTHNNISQDLDAAKRDGSVMICATLSKQLGLIAHQIRQLDFLQKELIRPKKKVVQCICPPGLPHKLRKHCSVRNQKPTIIVKKARKMEDNHPNQKMNQEEFLSQLGLVTHEKVRQNKLKTKKVERRRRTTTYNPKYTSNGFMQLDQLSLKRTRAAEQESVSSVNMDLINNGKVETYCFPKPSPNSCFVCEQIDCNLTCECCTTKYHENCIKVTGSNAPTPNPLLICPKCVQASNKLPMHRVMNRNTAKPPSIMYQSPLKKVVNSPVASTSSSFYLQQSTSNGFNSTNSSVANHVVDAATAALTVPKLSLPSNTKEDSSLAAKKIEMINSKTKIAKQSETGSNREGTRIAQVKLNMKRSLRELTPPTRAAPMVPPRINTDKGITALKWKNKNHNLRKNTRRRIPCISSTEIAAMSQKKLHFCQESICITCRNPNEVNKSCTEDEENSTANQLVFSNNNNVKNMDTQSHKELSLSSSDQSSIKNGPKESKSEGKGKVTALKVHPPNSLSVKKTIIAMTAAAACVMSAANASKASSLVVADITKPKDNSQSIMDSISSVIAQAVSEDHYHSGQTPSPDPDIPKKSLIKSEPESTGSTLLPPTSETDAENTPSSSMQGQLSDVEELLSLSNSPTFRKSVNQTNVEEPSSEVSSAKSNI